MAKFNIIWFDELDSTNTYLKNLLSLPSGHQDTKDWTVIAAKKQALGRGRKQRSWLSFEDKNLTFSVLIKTELDLEKLSGITIAAGVAVAEYLKGKGIAAQLKWPNDVMVDGKKICGILAELASVESFNSNYIILGIGLNVNMNLSEASAIDKPATSMSIVLGEALNLDAILRELLLKLKQYVDTWQKDEFAKIKKEWQLNCAHADKTLTITNIKGEVFTATFDSLGANGELVVKREDGSLETLIEADLKY